MTTTDHRHDLVRSFGHAAEITEGVRPGQLAAGTPCPEFDVASMVDHLVGAGWRAVALGKGQQPGDDEFPHVELAEAPDELRRAAKEAEAAWSDADRLGAQVTMPWGETYTGATLVNMYLTELAAHTWDLAVATGQLERLDPGLAAPALDAARAMLKPEYRDMIGKGNPFGGEVTAPPDATDWERFAAYMGRTPR
jgi:uncharacterized protein (TIGR03086 family)